MNTTSILERYSSEIYARFAERNYLPTMTMHYFVDKTDGKFTQVGLGILLDVSFFEPQQPMLFGLDRYGFAVAKGELEHISFFLKQNLKKVNLAKKLTGYEFMKKVISASDTSINDIRIILPDLIFEKALKEPLDYNIGWSQNLNRFAVIFLNTEIPVYTVSDNILGNNIIIYNVRDISCLTLAQKNHTKESIIERLAINVSEINGKIRFEIKTVIKLEVTNPATKSIILENAI